MRHPAVMSRLHLARSMLDSRNRIEPNRVSLVLVQAFSFPEPHTMKATPRLLLSTSCLFAETYRCRDRVYSFVRAHEDRGKTAPFLFILNIMVPGNPIVCTVMYWALDNTRGGDGEGSPAAEQPQAYNAFVSMLERCVHWCMRGGSAFRVLRMAAATVACVRFYHFCESGRRFRSARARKWGRLFYTLFWLRATRRHVLAAPRAS